jgi:hypothetical protein
MAKTNAENQAAYKNRHLKDVSGTSERLDVLINVSAKIALKRLAKHYRVSQRAMLETIIADKQAALTANLSSEQQTAFYDSLKITG